MNKVGRFVIRSGFLVRRSISTTMGDAYQSHWKDGKFFISLAEMADDDDDPDDNLILSLPPKDDDIVPETVLQYERQLRKRKAADRAGSTLVTKEQHLHILYEDPHVIVTNKPSGILCVPGINHNPCLLSLVHEEYAAPSSLERDKMIVHRLDMDTSGIVVFGRTTQAVRTLQKAFRERMVEKLYEALVVGHVFVGGDEGVIDLPLQRDHERPPFMRVSTTSSEQAAAQAVHDLQHYGWKKLVKKRPKPSQTEWKVLGREYLEKLPVTRLSLTPITGRTHQLRVHCAALGHAIVGDPAYGIYGEASPNGGFSDSIMDQIAPHRASIALQKQLNNMLVRINKTSSTPLPMCLHAKRLSLHHPITGEKMTWEAPTPF